MPCPHGNILVIIILPGQRRPVYQSVPEHQTWQKSSTLSLKSRPSLSSQNAPWRRQSACMCSHRWWLITGENGEGTSWSRRALWLRRIRVLTPVNQVNWKSNMQRGVLLSRNAISALGASCKIKERMVSCGVSQCSLHFVSVCDCVWSVHMH